VSGRTSPIVIQRTIQKIRFNRLIATSAGAFDLNAACSSFVAGLDVASRYIRSSTEFSNILVIGGYAMSKYLDKRDKKTATLFANGAGAVLLSLVESGNRGFLGAKQHTEGEFHEWMGIYAGGTHYPISQEALARGDHYFKFTRKFPKKKNAETWTRMILSLCHQLSIEPDDVDHYFMTQIDINSIYETMDNLNVERQKAYTIMEMYAYTGAACIPMALEYVGSISTTATSSLSSARFKKSAVAQPMMPQPMIITS